jgi:(p)ppGpp synthase/HD superfamily hydrolase
MDLYTEMTMKAFDIALKAFENEKDKAGKPYMGHLMRVADGAFGPTDIREKLVVVGLLHDLIEDTHWKESDLRGEFPDDVVDAIVAITKVEGESYVERVVKDPLATRVKISDLKDNMDVTRLPRIKDKDIERLKKYHMTYKYLTTLI